MLADVKKYAENHDIKGLRYIFMDSLDVDPTFEKYRDDYNYCKSIEGMFDSYQDMTPLIDDRSQWTRMYYDKLKSDLSKNFSEKRFEHMIRVAKVVYADKVIRLEQERNRPNQVRREQFVDVSVKNTSDQISTNVNNVPSVSRGGMSKQELENQRIERKRKELAEQYERDLKKEKQNVSVEYTQQRTTRGQELDRGDDELKKVLGIVLIVIAVIVVIILIWLLR